MARSGNGAHSQRVVAAAHLVERGPDAHALQYDMHAFSTSRPSA